MLRHFFQFLKIFLKKLKIVTKKLKICKNKLPIFINSHFSYFDYCVIMYSVKFEGVIL